MTMLRPTLHMDFANNPGFVDPRASYNRTGVGSYFDRHGVRRLAPANVPRFDFDPVTGRCRGLLLEGSRSNLFLRSGDLSHAAWTASDVTATANQAAAADGAVTLAKLSVTAPDAYVLQYCAVTLNHTVTVSVYARAGASQFLKLALGDLTSQASQWFNIAAGTKGSGFSEGATCAFAYGDIEDCGGGLYRCSLTAVTNTNTSWYGAVVPCNADLASAVIGNEIYAGDAQFETSTSVTTAASSYIPTTTVAVTRGGEGFQFPTTGSWYNPAEGTLLVDFLVTRRTPETGVVYGGIGDTFSNTIYFSRTANLIYYTALSSAVGQATFAKTADYTIGARNRYAAAWKAHDLAAVINGGAATLDSVATLPIAPVRLMIGGAPYIATGGTNPFDVISAFSYFPHRLSTAEMQAITAPTT
jgi:hypothetical protein